MISTLCIGVFFSPAFSASLKSMPPDEAVAAIEAMVKGKKSGKANVEQLIGALKDPNAAIKVKESAAWALGQLEATSAVPALLQAGKHKGLLVRSAALGALAHLRARAALPLFQSIAAHDPILTLRARATLAMGLLRWDKTIQPVVALSSDKSPEVRGAAALAMGATQSKANDFREALKEMLADEDMYVKERARKGLDVADRKNLKVIEHLEDEADDVRLFAALYFHHNGGKKELAAVKHAAESEADEEVRYELENAVKAIKRKIEKEKKAAAAAAAKKAAEKKASPKPAQK